MMASHSLTPSAPSKVTQLVHKIPEKAGGNLLKLKEGVLERKHILPKRVSYSENPKKIGLYQPNILDSKVLNLWVDQKPDFTELNVKIIKVTTSSMNQVPMIPHSDCWYVQYERQSVYKEPMSGWTFVDDNFSKRDIKFETLERAVDYCRNLGLGYTVEYPHYRYHTKKNYAENFKWKGPNKTYAQTEEI